MRVDLFRAFIIIVLSIFASSTFWRLSYVLCARRVADTGGDTRHHPRRDCGRPNEGRNRNCRLLCPVMLLPVAYQSGHRRWRIPIPESPAQPSSQPVKEGAYHH